MRLTKNSIQICIPGNDGDFLVLQKAIEPMKAMNGSLKVRQMNGPFRSIRIPHLLKVARLPFTLIQFE